MDAAALYENISPVCPIISTTVNHPTDRAQWFYEPKAQATASEKAAADNVIATIPAAINTRVLTSDFVARWTNAEYLALEKKRTTDNGSTAKNWDIITTSDYIDINRKKVQSVKADLVADGILTQARADEIFA